DYDGILDVIPNRNIEYLSNYSGGEMRAGVDIGFSYDHNIGEAFRVAQSVCDNLKEDEDIVEGPNVDGIENINNHEVVLRVTAQTKNMMQWGVQRKLWKNLKEAFDENAIEMPYEHSVNVVRNEK